MTKCVCGHSEKLHVTFGRERPCIDAHCSCEDFDFGGSDTVITIPVGADVMTVPLTVEPCPPDGKCGECVYPPCPNKGRGK